jgi:3-oxoadipate enol-lactonase
MQYNYKGTNSRMIEIRKSKDLFLLMSVLLSTAVFAETLKVDGGTIYYEVRGEGSPVILLHGSFGDLRMWNGQFEALARRYQVIRYDQLGFGHSSMPDAPYSPASILLQLTNHLGIQKAILIGNSMGGTLAIDFTLLHPDHVSSIVIVGSGPDGYPIPKKDQDEMNAVFSTAAEKGLSQAVELWLANPMVAVAIQNPNSKDLLQKMVKDNAGILLMRFWPKEKMEPPALQRLKEIYVPTLVVIGEKDQPVVQAIADAAASGIPGAKKVKMQDTDHLPQMEKPEEFNKIVLDFLKESQL